MHRLYKYACDELMELEDKAGSGGLSMQELEYADKLTELKKNILKIRMLEGRSEYSGNGGMGSYRSYDMMNRGGIGNMDGESLYDGEPDPEYLYSGRGRRRNRMGRYSSAGVSNRSYRGYSSAEQGMDQMIKELQELLPEIPADKQKDVQKLIHTLEQM